MKKKYQYGIMLLGLIAFNLYLFFPVSPETVLERNIRWAKENGTQLEQVLEHYQQTGEEQKERCARYLIEHMDRRAAFTYEGIVQEKEIITPDLFAIRTDFLIENIDLAFEVWKKYPWCSHLTEQEFCRLILPYRMKNEPLEDWRSFYYHRYKEVADSLAAAGATMKEVVLFFNTHYAKRYTHDAEIYRGDLSYKLIEKIGGGTCDHLALNAAQVMRSIGIPLNIDVLPYHGKVNGGHAYNSFTDEKGEFHFFSPYEREPERNRWIAPVVMRICYESPVYQEVTRNYFPVSDVVLERPNLSIATYNRGHLNEIKRGVTKNGKTTFRDLSRGLLYFPVDTMEKTVGIPPFILGEDGAPCFIPSPERERTLCLKGMRLYDVKRVLTLDTACTYTLRGWNNGWHDIATALPTDSLSLHFDSVPDYKLFVICGRSPYVADMQRPFVILGDSVVYY